jgi:hypothetical protein
VTETTREQLVALLNDVYNQTLHLIRQMLPSVSMEARDSRNDNFPFRSYAQYSHNRRVIVISVDVKIRNGKLLLSGDIAREDGYVIKEIFVDLSVSDDAESEVKLVSHINNLFPTCHDNASLIQKELTS